jgi:hypothetical protein
MEIVSDLKFRDIFNSFTTGQEFRQVVVCANGHINTSYQIHVKEQNHTGYFLQHLNTNIFKDVDALMDNISLVVNHLKSKELARENHCFLELILTKDGKKYFTDAENQCWRLFNYIKEGQSYHCADAHLAYESGRIFGRFLSDLSDLDASKLGETIPRFHDLELRLEQFHEALAKNNEGRIASAAAEISFVNSQINEMLQLTRLINSGKLPLHVTHNDTKLNNVLFNKDRNAICVVDLDTVMPGSILFDYGDAIRTGANTAIEDEPDISKVDLNVEAYRMFTKGFLKNMAAVLTENEIERLAFSARFMTFIIGLRFLTDYLNSDIYFKTQYPEHNLTRTRVQFEFFRKLVHNAHLMESIVQQNILEYAEQI